MISAFLVKIAVQPGSKGCALVDNNNNSLHCLAILTAAYEDNGSLEL